MPLKPYEELVEPLAFPINGRTYTPRPIGARTEEKIARWLGGDAGAGEGDSRSVQRMLLGCTADCDPHTDLCSDDCEEHAGECGSVFDQMIADDVPLRVISHAAFAMLATISGGNEAAEKLWNSPILTPIAAAPAVGDAAATAAAPVKKAASAKKRPKRPRG